MRMKALPRCPMDYPFLKRFFDALELIDNRDTELKGSRHSVVFYFLKEENQCRRTGGKEKGGDG